MRGPVRLIQRNCAEYHNWMMQKPIYLDTNLWNCMVDQNVDPPRLLDQLKRGNANLALSGQTIYELAKTFPANPERARTLFQYLKRYVGAGIIAAHDNMEQLFGEVDAMHARASGVVAYYSAAQYALLKAEVNKLAQGDFEDVARQFVSDRKQFSQSTREDQKIHFESNAHMRAQLQSVPETDLPAWLQSELMSDRGTALLAQHLMRIFELTEPDLAINNAHYLLRHPRTRIAKGIVRSDLYSNWRCANTRSVPRDLVDDMYHVLNASYCSIYATAEAKQTKYALLLLSSPTRIAVYDGKTPVEEWLIGLVDRAVPMAA